MTIVEALESGKPFRLAGGVQYYNHFDLGFLYPSGSCADKFSYRFKLSQDDLLSYDWEIIEQKVMISRSDLDRALTKVLLENDGIPRFGELCKELGL